MTDTSSYRYADKRIEDLLNKLKSKGVCGCCTARALTLHAVCLAEQVLGSAETIEMFEEFIAITREHNIPAPNYDKGRQTH